MPAADIRYAVSIYPRYIRMKFRIPFVFIRCRKWTGLALEIRTLSPFFSQKECTVHAYEALNLLVSH